MSWGIGAGQRWPRPEALGMSEIDGRSGCAAAPLRYSLLRRHLEAMADLNALPDGSKRASHRLLLRTLG